MNILVCVKQVPDTTEIKIDPVKNTLIRDGVEYNAINTVMENSGWPKMIVGTNEFSYTVDEGEMELAVYHTNQYVGV